MHLLVLEEQSLYNRTRYKVMWPSGEISWVGERWLFNNDQITFGYARTYKSTAPKTAKEKIINAF